LPTSRNNEKDAGLPGVVRFSGSFKHIGIGAFVWLYRAAWFCMVQCLCCNSRRGDRTSLLIQSFSRFWTFSRGFGYITLDFLCAVVSRTDHPTITLRLDGQTEDDASVSLQVISTEPLVYIYLLPVSSSSFRLLFELSKQSWTRQFGLIILSNPTAVTQMLG
jgi:hypothetical protein